MPTWARYRTKERILEIDFKGKSGAKQSTYEYADVPAEVFAQLNASDLPARFYALHIRNEYKAVKTWSAR